MSRARSALAASSGARTSRCLAWLAALILSGCAGPLLDPAFPVTLRDAREAWAAMEEEPVALERPVVVLGGIHDPGFAAPKIVRRLRRVCGDDAPAIAVSFFTTGDFETCRRRAVEAVQRAWPSPHGDETVEVDVIGVSMGGLVARYAARPRTDGAPRLRIRRLYTIASPHLGARLAELPTFDSRILDMRAGSAFLDVLNRFPRSTDPELVAYARLDDAIVGEKNTAPPGMTALLVPNAPLTFSHMNASSDLRIVADIARRLRGEPPLASRTAGPKVGTADHREP